METALDGMAYDYYAMLTHLAVAQAFGQQVGVISVPAISGTADLKTHQSVALAWEIRTRLIEPVGSSAIVGGMVTSTEPLEAIAYQADYKPRSALKPGSLHLDEFRDNVHIWDWYKASTELQLVATFVAKIGSRTFNVQLQEFEMMGMGARARRVYFLTPYAAAAISRMWCDWMEAEAHFISSRANKGDDLNRQTFKGLALNNGIGLVTLLATIGNTSAGGRIAKLIRTRISEELYAVNMVDEISRLQVGVFDARLRVWAGLQTLSLLGLLTAEMATIMFATIKDTDAMTAFVSMKGIGGAVAREME